MLDNIGNEIIKGMTLELLNNRDLEPGIKLLYLRYAMGGNKQLISEMLGISSPTYTKYETGEKELPLHLARIICEDTNIAVTDFYGKFL